MAIKKKKFFHVEVPLIGEGVELYASDIEELDGRHIKLDLTRLLRGKSVEVSFDVYVKDGKAVAKPFRSVILSYFIRRIMRKRADYVEDSFIVESKDSLKLRVKPFMIARKMISRAVRNALRKASKEYLTAYIKDKTSEEIFSEIVQGRMQRPMALVMKKTYPLAFCDIRQIEVKRSA